MRIQEVNEEKYSNFQSHILSQKQDRFEGDFRKGRKMAGSRNQYGGHTKRRRRLNSLSLWMLVVLTTLLATTSFALTDDNSTVSDSVITYSDVTRSSAIGVNTSDTNATSNSLDTTESITERVSNSTDYPNAIDMVVVIDYVDDSAYIEDANFKDSASIEDAIFDNSAVDSDAIANLFSISEIDTNANGPNVNFSTHIVNITTSGEHDFSIYTGDTDINVVDNNVFITTVNNTATLTDANFIISTVNTSIILTKTNSSATASAPYTAYINYTANTVNTSSNGTSMTTTNFTILIPPITSTASVNATSLDALVTDGAYYVQSQCQQLYASKAVPLRTEGGHEDWMYFIQMSKQGRLLANLMRFHELATLEEGEEWTVLCVGAMNVASYSFRNGTSSPTAGLELQTRRDAPVGIVRLRTRCWLDTGLFAECSPSFIPSPNIRKLSLYHNSPLEEAFWTNLNSTTMGMNPSWIRKMNITTFQGSIPSNWIYKMNLPMLEYLQIRGNNWGVSKTIICNMPKLIYLNLGDNNLASIPEDMFNDMLNLEVIILDQNNLSRYPSSIRRLKRLIHLDISNSVGNSVLRIEDEDIKLLPKRLKALVLANIKLRANLNNILLLPELHILNISGTAVDINDNTIAINTRKIVALDTSGNINYVWYGTPDYVFATTPEVKISNLLHLLPSFPMKKSLTRSYLVGNQTIILTPEKFMHLKKLEFLDLSHCLLKHILRPIFQNAYALKKVDLSYNLLNYIPSYLFSSLPKLQEVDLSHNYLTIVYLWEWKLRKLDLSSNVLNDFRSNETAIEDVILSYNYVINLDISLSSVEKLNLSYNSFSTISSTLLENISQTLEVDLGGNYFHCCSFENALYLNYEYDTVIYNLGSMEPLKCYIDSEVSNTLFGTFEFDNSQCRTGAASITSYTIVIAVVVLIFFAAILLVLARHVIQAKKKKFTLEHSPNVHSINFPS